MNNKRRLIAAPGAFDENGLLRDGYTARVPVTLRDGRSNSLSDAADRAALNLNSCRPGYRFANPANDSMRERRAWASDAYAEVEHRLQNEWRDGSNGPTGAGSFRGQQEGDQCTINGAPGHLERGANGRLQCIADDADENHGDEPWHDRDSAFAVNQTHDATERALEAYRLELVNAWRRG